MDSGVCWPWLIFPVQTTLMSSDTARRPYLPSIAKDWMVVPPVKVSLTRSLTLSYTHTRAHKLLRERERWVHGGARRYTTCTHHCVQCAARLHILDDWYSPVPAARRSPRVSAPSDCRRLATADAKRRSPPIEVMSSLNSGAEVWFDRWLRPICWTAWSAAQGSCNVMCTRRL